MVRYLYWPNTDRVGQCGDTELVVATSLGRRYNGRPDAPQWLSLPREPRTNHYDVFLCVWEIEPRSMLRRKQTYNSKDSGTLTRSNTTAIPLQAHQLCMIIRTRDSGTITGCAALFIFVRTSTLVRLGRFRHRGRDVASLIGTQRCRARIMRGNPRSILGLGRLVLRRRFESLPFAG